MKKRLLLFMVVLYSFGFYSCTKTVTESPEAADEITQADQMETNGNSSHYGCMQLPGSTIFDIACLVSPASHGRLDTIQKGFGFTEGPAVDEHGNVFFTDQPNDKIYKWKASTGQITTFLTGTGRSNGMMFNKNGYLISCADLHGEIWKIRPDGSHQVLINKYNGKLLNGPNDIWINPKNGGMYITDPLFPRGYWDANDPRRKDNFQFNAATNTYTGGQNWPPTHSEQGPAKAGHVYYLAPGSHNLIRLTTMAGWNADVWPNGVVGTPDGKKLYVNEWTGDNTGTIWVFDIKANGTLDNMKIFVDNLRGCDGMSMDERGNVYVSNSEGVTAFNKYGQKVFNVPCGPAGNSGATNNVFAGKDEKLLFITGTADRITSLKMKVKGVERFDDNGGGYGHGYGHGGNNH